MTKVVLIYPSNKFGGSVQSRVELPLGLLAVGSPLARAGYDVKIIDQRRDAGWREALGRELASGPICLGISSMTGPQIRNGIEAARMGKAAGVTVVWGGIHATLLPQQTVLHPAVDIVVEGEGEETFFELVQALESSRPIDQVRGVWWKQDGQARSSGTRPHLDLNRQEPLAYHLVKLSDYLIDVFGRGHLSLETSRGCPFRCSYCYNTRVYGGTWRSLCVDEAMRRIRLLVRDHGVKGILFTDDNFFGKQRWALEVLRRIVDERLDVTVSKIDAHVASLARLTDDELRLLARAGCKMVMMGIESGSPRILRMLNKPTRIPELLHLNRRLRGSGVRPHYFFMMGFPGETEDDLRQTLALKTQLSRDNPEGVPRFNIFTAFPGTPLYEECRNQGLRPHERLEDWVTFNYRTVNDRAVWLSAEQKAMIRMLHFATLLAERNNFINPYKKTPLWVKLAASLYLPVARFRVENTFHRFPLDLKLAEWLGVYPKQGA
jgi:anaerobic magnesium-protoporphyrin IX monomethyl ester cyclase